MTNCVICNKNTNNKYCSPQCRKEASHRKSTFITNCEWCKKDFENTIISNRKFCTKECRLEYNRSDECNKKRVATIRNNRNKLTSEQIQQKNLLQSQKTKATKLLRYGNENYTNIEKSKQTKLLKYGNKNYNNIEKNEQTRLLKYGNKKYNNREKFRKTMNSLYGVDYTMQSEIFREKSKNSVLEKYGVTSVALVPEITQRKRETCLKKYGTINPMQNKDIKQRAMNTSILKYNGIGWASGSLTSQKINNTIKEKYGVDNIHLVSSLSSTKLKVKQTNKIRFGTDYFTQSSYYKKSRFKKRYDSILKSKITTPMFTPEEFTEYEIKYKFKCNICNTIFESDLVNHNIIPRCLSCFPIQENRSFVEKEIFSFIKNKLDNNALHNAKIPNSKSEMDIYIPEKKLAIEVDGIYWHTEIAGGKEKQFHLNKSELCLKNDIKLLHIWDIEWDNKQDIIKSILTSRLKPELQTIIYGRNTKVVELNVKEKDKFILDNHLLGIDICNKSIGLYYNDELVSVMTFRKSKFNKNYQWEISRFANKLNTRVVGGASKLFSYFVKAYNPTSIISYSNKRLFDGSTYEKLNFVRLHDTAPNYYYYKSNGIYNRLQFQKHKLKDKLERFDETLTEWENMQINGYDRIWDCGNMKFVWNKKE